MNRMYNTVYEGDHGSRITYPLGGIGSGMIGLEGTGALSHISLRHHPNMLHEPMVFSAVCIKHAEGNIARVLEGPVPTWKVFTGTDPGNGLGGKHYGLPRFASSKFHARFPFGTVELLDSELPLDVSITGWSPFIPLHADDSSLPAAGLEFTFANKTGERLEIVYSFNASHFMKAADNAGHRVLRTENGFVLDQPAIDGKPWAQGGFSAATDQPQTIVNCAWFRGGWFDPLTMVWNTIESGECPEKPPVTEGMPSPGASLYVPLTLEPGERKTIRLLLSWYVPESDLTAGVPAAAPGELGDAAGHTGIGYYKPWYAKQFGGLAAVAGYWSEQYDRLRAESRTFSDCFYDTTLPEEIKEAISANLSILKSPTVLRQSDGRLWGWEGCHDDRGACHGSCSHVWNYAQALPHLFPELERGLRLTEFGECQDERGHQNFRAPLPIQPADHLFHAASDGQLGSIMKAYREWRVSGDTEWLKQLWPKVEQNLHYCTETWDPDRIGILVEPHHNTYDIEFWGPDGMCSSIYLGALKAASIMAEAMGEAANAGEYDALYRKGRHYMESELFNGEYFDQKIVWTGLRAPSPFELQSFQSHYSPEAVELMQEQGPKYQYGKGCLSDGVIGAWLAEMCGLGDILDREKVRSHLLSVYKYNLKRDLSKHANPQRPGYALGSDGGLLLCTWPKGGKLALPFVYSNEVWTGIEYQVASHLLALGCIEEGLEIVRVCRDRYDGRKRNPFNEYEWGHWYARAMASYALIQGWSGIRYDACDRTLFISKSSAGKGDYSSFLSTGGGYGTAGIKDGKPFVHCVSGEIPVERIEWV
ncbi:non-lysosomal glucosylceramidase [Paenibacillus spongiae]|uniref:Non-lysosomal glucosylceramidase n=1 Tax=Paenibacillus spongiae TaxID=2909671 RepID=A0ABY5S6S3_9BACL|nr:non-lysosomal glucosylceramidase [Paenibacillus spongiae]UVI29285.1 non-lysosomal glucosylceramidase [Paenibacillus spongiae]